MQTTVGDAESVNPVEGGDEFVVYQQQAGCQQFDGQGSLIRLLSFGNTRNSLLFLEPTSSYCVHARAGSKQVRQG